MKHLFSRSLILFASTFVSLFIATQSAWGADAVVWDFTGMSKNSFTEGESYNFTASDGVSIMTYTAGEDDAIVAEKESFSYLKQNGTTKDSKRNFELKVTGKGKIKIETITNAGEWNIYDGSSAVALLVKDYVGFLSGKAETETIELTVNTSLYFTTTTKGYIYKITWTPSSSPASPSSYTVTYNANEGTCGTTSATYSGTPLTLPTPTRDGFTCTGWYDAAIGGNLIGKAGASYSPTKDITLYAQWNQLYTVTYALNGGSGNAPTQASLCKGETFKVASADGITKTGYTFAGWSDGSKTYVAGDTYTMGTANVTLTAQWEKQNGVSIVIFDGAKDTKNTSTGGTNYSTTEDHSDGTTGFQWKLSGQKDALVDVNSYASSTYSKAIQQGGSDADKYNIMFVVPDGYALTLNIAYAASAVKKFGLNKGTAIKADGSNCSEWNATIEAESKIYKVEIADLAAGTYYLQGAGDACCFAYIKATVTSTVVKPVVEKKAPHRNYQIANRRDLRPYTSATHYPLFDVTPKATAEYTGDKKWVASYTIHAANTGIITAGKATIDWVREDAKKGDTITLGADYVKLGTWLSKYHSTAVVGDTIMLTMRAVNACNQPDDATADSIPIILTDKYSLAYIVSGDTITRKFYDITKSDTIDQLYKNLCAQYNVTPVSAYATYSYTNYEPYDLLLLTDYPKGTGTNNQASYVDSLADLVDRKPILSLKAHMASLEKWQKKGSLPTP